MKMVNCQCGAPAMHIKIERRKETINGCTFTFAAEHRVECSAKCGQVTRRDTATATKKAWNERMKSPVIAKPSEPG
jgi:hypothetical protein